MADGDKLILGNDNDAESQTSLKTELSNGTSGLYGLHVQALKGNAMGGLSRDGFGIEGISTSRAGVAGTSTNDDGVFGSSSNGTGAHGTSINGSGVRDIVRVLGVSSATVIDVLKKKRARDHTGQRTSPEEP